MATPLNTFKTVTAIVTTEEEIIYTAPPGNTGIVLMAQVANISDASAITTFSHFRSQTNTDTELVKDFIVPGKDAASLITGKLIVEQGDSLKIIGYPTNFDPNSPDPQPTVFKLTLSVLESLNA